MSAKTTVQLVHDPIDHAALVEAVRSPVAGAVVLLVPGVNNQMTAPLNDVALAVLTTPLPVQPTISASVAGGSKL